MANPGWASLQEKSTVADAAGLPLWQDTNVRCNCLGDPSGLGLIAPI